MTVERRVSRLFNLTDENWMKHSNPWSVWTRFTVLPLLVLAFWSRVWLGWWSLIPIVLAVAWMLLNPVLFKPSRSTANWASKGVLGERVWANRDNVAVPAHHRALPNILNGIAAAGTVLVIWGVVSFSVWPTITGLFVAISLKLWFVDRMVWLYEDMKHVPEYGKWLY